MRVPTLEGPGPWETPALGETLPLGELGSWGNHALGVTPTLRGTHPNPWGTHTFGGTTPMGALGPWGNPVLGGIRPLGTRPLGDPGPWETPTLSIEGTWPFGDLALGGTLIFLFIRIP